MASKATWHAGIRASGRGPPPLISFVAVGQVAPLTGFLREIGAPLERLLRRSHIPVALIEEAEALLPLHLVHRLIEVAASSEGIPDLGVVLGERTTVFDLPILGSALRRAVTVRDYLQRGIQLIGEVQPGERFWLTLEPGRVRFHQVVPGRLCAGRHHADLYTLAVTIQMLRRFIGGDWSPLDVHLAATDRSLVGDGSVFGDAEIRLGQPHSSFTISEASLMKTLPPEVRVMSEVTRPAGFQTAIPQDFLSSLEKITLDLLKAEALRIEAVAEAAELSTRTMQRRLGEIGLTYSTLVARVRCRVAVELLSQTELPVRQIAAAVGYKDPANFTRAFRRIAGKSPQEYRGRCRRAADASCRA